MVRASIDDPEYVRELREELIAEAADPEVVCESCGNVQADMGRGVACEGCGEGPMPTADGPAWPAAPEGPSEERVAVTVEGALAMRDAVARAVADAIVGEFDGADPLEAAVQSGEAVAAQPALAGTGVAGVALAAGDLWDPVDGHRIRELGLGVGGTLRLFAGNEFHRQLAGRLARNGAEFSLTLRGTVESHGTKVDRFQGAMVGLLGTARFKAIEIVDVEEYYEALGELRDRMDDGMNELAALMDDVREEGRGATADPRIQARALLRGLARVQAAFAGVPAAAFVRGEERPRGRFIDLIREAEADPLPDPAAVCVCGHAANAHAGAEMAGPCDTVRVIVMGDGERRREGCLCADFRPAAGAIGDACANCEHGEHADSDPGCEIETRRQQYTLDGEIADVWGPCGCRYWQPSAVAEGGAVAEPSPLERELGASVEIALARASGRATVGVVAPEGQRCGQLHAGHLEPCPFDAFECDLPAVAVEGSQP